jgi:hypothetical protein
MKQPKPRRITRTVTASQRARLREQRRLIAAELPDLTARDRMCKEAGDEPTLSGELRRAIPPVALDEFLTGERTLRSDVLDRLATGLGLELVARN